jgi:RNA recognition motif-containing protein
MGNRLYVGNLSFTMTEAQLRQEFGKCGNVTDAKIVNDRESGRSRGFGFVQYSTEGEATTAIQAFNGTSVGGRVLVVNIAEDRARTGGGGGQRNFGGGGGGAPRSNGGGYNQGGGYSSGPPNDQPSGGGGGRGRGGKGSRRRREDSEWG